MDRATVVGVSLAAALLSACASSPGALFPASLSSQDREQAHETGAQLDRLYRVITAPSADHLNAGQLLARRGEQITMRDCMARAGFAYGPTFNRGPSWTEEDMDGGFGAATWLAPHGEDVNWSLDSVNLLDYVKAAVPNFRDFDRDVPPQGEPPKEVSRRCEAKAENAFVLFPSSRDALYESLNDLVAIYDRELEQFASAYRDCMKAAGYGVDSPAQLVDLLQRESYGKTLQAPGPDAEANDAWLSMLERERTATAASNECSAAMVESGMYAMADALDVWESKHSEELKQVTREWDDMLADALTYPEANQVFIDLPPLLPGALPQNP